MNIFAQFLDFILHLDHHLAELLQAHGAWVYGILFLIVFSETGLVIMPFLPGDSLLFVAGTLAAGGGLNVHAIVVLLIAAAILGDTVNYWVGHRLGRRLFQNPGARMLRPEFLARTERFYAKYGAKTIVLARFVPIVRTFAPFVAGMGRMPYTKFLAYNVIGAVTWVALFTYAGYLFGQMPLIKDNFTWVVLAIIAVSVLPVVIELVKARRTPA